MAQYAECGGNQEPGRAPIACQDARYARRTKRSAEENQNKPRRSRVRMRGTRGAPSEVRRRTRTNRADRASGHEVRMAQYAECGGNQEPIVLVRRRGTFCKPCRPSA